MLITLVSNVSYIHVKYVNFDLHNYPQMLFYIVPMDLDVKMKAVVLAATFLIDFMFFETNQNNQNR